MCIDYEFELEWDLKCQICGKKPAVNLEDPTGDTWGDDDYTAICEKCGIEIFGESIVSDWAGTELYLKKHPDMVPVWKE